MGKRHNLSFAQWESAMGCWGSGCKERGGRERRQWRGVCMRREDLEEVPKGSVRAVGRILLKGLGGES